MPRPLRVAEQLGATRTTLAADAEAVLDAHRPDIVIESSGSTAGIGTAIRVVRNGGIVVAVGQLPPDIPAPLHRLVGREITVTGSSRFADEPAEVIAALLDGSLVIDPVISHVMPIERFEEAFAVAFDSAVSSKVLLDFGQD